MQFKRAQSGRKTFYVVVSAAGKHRWLKAGTLKKNQAPQKEIDSMATSERLEVLGIVAREKQIDSFFQEYLGNCASPDLSPRE